MQIIIISVMRHKRGIAGVCLEDDGTYTYKDNIYKYKIEVSNVEGESQATFVVLINNTQISIEDISDSLKKRKPAQEYQNL